MSDPLLAKLASGLLYSWSLLRNNNTAIIFKCSLQVTVVGVLPHVTRLSLRFFPNQICFLVDLCAYV